MAHYRAGVSTQLTLRRTKHSTPTISAFTHSNTGIKQ